MQHVAGDGEFVDGGAGIAKRVVEDEVFEMDELAVDPQRGTGITEILPFEEAGTNRRTGDAHIETGERNGSMKAVRIRAVYLFLKYRKPLKSW
ncbi:conserved hypothetical protein [Agrobacterium fabacearum S56]|nr:conserved hypothetical protein [Agrobacterium fabacearum S56]